MHLRPRLCQPDPDPDTDPDPRVAPPGRTLPLYPGHRLCPDPDPTLCPDPSPCTPPAQTLHLDLGPSLVPNPDPSTCTPHGQTLPLGHRIYSDPDLSPRTPPGQTLPLGHRIFTDPDPSSQCSGTHPPLRAPHHRADSPTWFHPIPSEMLLRLKPPCQSPGSCPADVFLFLTPVMTSPLNLMVMMTHSHSVLRRQLTAKPTSLHPKSR